MKTVLVTGSSGLVGSECVRHFAGLGWKVRGLDNDLRRTFFGRDGDTYAAWQQLHRDWPDVVFHDDDLRDRLRVSMILEHFQPDLVIHAAAQPSHDYAADHPFEDFEVNAGGTLNLLEAVRQHAPEAAFCFLSTNKVYGDWPNDWHGYDERPTRYDLGSDWPGFDEDTEVDRCMHSLFGCSKLAADIYTQEYGRYFGLKTVSLRCGCITGGAHAAAEQHGFLAYLAKCCREGRPYKVYGYKGKQVRDQLHAHDVARACEEFYRSPRPGEVYNLGGGRANSVSVLEAIKLIEDATGRKLQWEYVDQPRKGDHIYWITDTSKFRSHYPGWSVTRSLADIVRELCGQLGQLA